MSKFFLQDDSILYKDDTHQYFHKDDGNEYTSVTRLCASVKVPFEKQKISSIMAIKLSGELGISHAEAQKQILDSWDKKRDDSCDWGTMIHNSIEGYFRDGKYDPSMKKVIDQVSGLLNIYYRFYPEVLLHSYNHKVAGKADIVVQRQKSSGSLYDFYDTKTFLHRGVEFDSIAIKNGDVKHYNRFLLHPFEHLEQCNYIMTCLQLSTYALMGELQYGIKVGKLGMLFFDNDLNMTMYPIPYMRTDAMILLNLNTSRKVIPEVVKQSDDW